MAYRLFQCSLYVVYHFSVHIDAVGSAAHIKRMHIMEMHHSSLCLVRSRFSCASVRESNYMFVDLSGSVLKRWRGSGQSDRVYRWLLLVHRKLELWWCSVFGLWNRLWPVMWWPREVRRSVFIAMEAEAHRIVMEGPIGIALRAKARAEQRKD